MERQLDRFRSQRCVSEIHRLEMSLKSAQEHHSSLRTQFQQLREDFRYNLNVLAERDQELHTYEMLTSHDNNSQSSNLKLMEQQVQLSKSETSEEIQTKELHGVQENTTYLNIQRAQRCPDENHEEQLKEAHKAISKLQRDLDSLSAQALSMKIQHQEQLQERKDIIERYKKELSTSLEREKRLEQRMVQQELEWQKNCEDIQSKNCLDNEQLIQELTEAREKVNAELVETKVHLQELMVSLQCVTKERDLALQGCVPGTGPLAFDEITVLKQQNYRLQAVVSEMRKQMEELSSITPPHQTENNVNKEVVISKEEDVQHSRPNVTKVNEKPQKSSCVCSCGRVNRENSALTQLRSRLKQAAFCITRLNRDRQQLIELCNRLRAQVCNDELCNQSKSNTENQGVCEFSNNLKVENSAKEPRMSVDQGLLKTQSLLPNCSRLPKANRQSEESLPSLGALWALLDQRPTQDLSEDNAEDPVEDRPEFFSEMSLGLATGAEMELCGVRAPVHEQSTAKLPLKKALLTNTAKSVRIRNYNIKG